MATAHMRQGPTTKRVRENIRSIRRERGLQLDELSHRLTALGWPISVTGLSKIETGKRRVDADDLVAIAAALCQSPNRLLLPADASEDEIAVTPRWRTRAFDAWKWATGEKAPTLASGTATFAGSGTLTATGSAVTGAGTADTADTATVVDNATVVAPDVDDDSAFVAENRPHDPQNDQTTLGQIHQWQRELAADELSAAYTTSRDAGVPHRVVINWMDLLGPMYDAQHRAADSETEG
jgi:transcriptional regulator with XRE-family HTH domain